MQNIKIRENITVIELPGKNLQIDVYSYSDIIIPTTAIIFLPGGSWFTANRKPLAERFAVPLAKLGHVCITAEYRVASEGTWPLQVLDVKSVIDWVRTNSIELRVDEKKIVVAGKSAGGHLALLSSGVDYIDSKIQTASDTTVAGVVAISPVIDVGSMIGREDIAPFLGKNPSDESVANANPITHVSQKYPPTLLIHGTSDQRVHHHPTIMMYDALEKYGVPTDLVLFAGQDHSFDSDPNFSKVMVENINFFISRYVSDN
jgi:acetyl esterase/lipase